MIGIKICFIWYPNTNLICKKLTFLVSMNLSITTLDKIYFLVENWIKSIYQTTLSITIHRTLSFIMHNILMAWTPTGNHVWSCYKCCSQVSTLNLPLPSLVQLTFLSTIVSWKNNNHRNLFLIDKDVCSSPSNNDPGKVHDVWDHECASCFTHLFRVEHSMVNFFLNSFN